MWSRTSAPLLSRTRCGRGRPTTRPRAGQIASGSFTGARAWTRAARRASEHNERHGAQNRHTMGAHGWGGRSGTVSATRTDGSDGNASGGGRDEGGEGEKQVTTSMAALQEVERAHGVGGEVTPAAHRIEIRECRRQRSSNCERGRSQMLGSGRLLRWLKRVSPQALSVRAWRTWSMTTNAVG